MAKQYKTAEEIDAAVGKTMPLPGTYEAEIASLQAAEKLDEAVSLEQRRDAVRTALQERFIERDRQGYIDWDTMPFIRATFEDNVVFEREDKLWRIDYTFDESTLDATLDEGDPEQMQMEFVPTTTEDVTSEVTDSTEVLAESMQVEAVEDDGIRVTVIRPGWSLNDRYYPKEVLAASADKLEHARAFANHAGLLDNPERSVRDQIGYYDDVSVADDGRIQARLNLVGDAAAKDHIKAWAKESITAGKPLMGISIAAIGKSKRAQREGRRGQVVTEITDYFSADVVTRPAAGGEFVALAAAETITAALLDAMSYDEWKAANVEYAERLKEEAMPNEVTPDTTEVTTEVEETPEGTTLDARMEKLEQLVEAADGRIATLLDRIPATEVVEETEAEAPAQTPAERAASANALIEQVGVPFTLRPTVHAQLMALETAQWGPFLMAETAKLQRIYASQPVQNDVPPAAATAPQPGMLPVATDSMDVSQWERQVQA